MTRPDRVYLDYNASAPMRPEVEAAVSPLLFGDSKHVSFGNASSVHWAGQLARKHLEEARSRVASRVDRKPSDLVFTSGGTEADNSVLRGILLHPKVDKARLLTSAVEHPAVRATATQLAEQGLIDWAEIPVDGEGRLDLERLEHLLETPTTLVSVMAVNNETGIIHPLEDVIRLAHNKGAKVHVDAVQAPGRTALPLQADALSLSAHKIGGLKGIGALALSPDLAFAPELLGGPQERGKRAGTESVAAAVGLATALDLSLDRQDAEQALAKSLREPLESVIANIPGARILGAHTVANTLTAVFPGSDGEAVLQGLDLESIAVSSGSACSSGSLEASHVLLAMGVAPEDALTAVRFSWGWASTADDLARAAQVLPSVVARARGQ